MILSILNNKYMKHLVIFFMATTILSNQKSDAQAAKSESKKPTIIFVHGLWADGSSWSKVIPALVEKGYPVMAVQNPTTSLDDDVAATRRTIALAGGDVILVGHSWGGFVITEAGND